MITALVVYKEFMEYNHPLLDSEWVERSKIVKVSDLTDLNKMFKKIVRVDVLEKK